jgi:hypothetical protein
VPEIAVTAGGPAYEIEEGVYPAHITETVADELAQAKFASGRDILRIWIRLDDMVDPINNEDIDIDAIASRKLSPSTKLWGWLENLGFKLDPETVNTFNSDVLHGFAIRAVIGSKKKTDGSVWPTIENVLAPVKGSAGAAENEQLKAMFYKNGPRAVPDASPFDDGARDYTWFWSMAKRAGFTPEMVQARMTQPISGYSDDELIDLLDAMKSPA